MDTEPNALPTADSLAEKPRISLARRLLSHWILTPVVTFGLLAWVGVQVQRRRAENDALTQIYAMKSTGDLKLIHARVSNPFKPSEPPTDEVFFDGGPEWLTQWLGVDLFMTVTDLHATAHVDFPNEDGMIDPYRTSRRGISGRETESLNCFTNLEQLALAYNPVGDELGPVLDRLPRLQYLNLACTSVSDGVLPHVARLPQLESLNLFHTNVTDAGIEHLASVPTLLNLNVGKTDVSEGRIEWLRQQLPHCQIEH